MAPYPYNLNRVEDFDISSDFDASGANLVWYARPQLFFRCTLCPTGQTAVVRSHREVSLVFLSTFEPIDLTPDSCMQRRGVPMLYDSASCDELPSLYICHTKNILGRVPLMPCFVDGSTHPTIPYAYRSKGLPKGARADTKHDKGNGSRLYEVNLWMWRYGRGQPRKMPVLETMQLRMDRLRTARQVAWNTLKRRRLEAGASRD